MPRAVARAFSVGDPLARLAPPPRRPRTSSTVKSQHSTSARSQVGKGRRYAARDGRCRRSSPSILAWSSRSHRQWSNSATRTGTPRESQPSPWAWQASRRTWASVSASQRHIFPSLRRRRRHARFRGVYPLLEREAGVASEAPAAVETPLHLAEGNELLPSAGASARASRMSRKASSRSSDASARYATAATCAAVVAPMPANVGRELACDWKAWFAARLVAYAGTRTAVRE